MLVERDIDVLQIWSIFTSQLHFTIARPIIAMYILLKFGLFDINEETKPMAKMMSIILIVVATSAILELVQAVIPINQMISAALLGIIIAFGIGWEEKSFNNLVSNQAHLRNDIDKKWFPEISIPRKYINRIDLACLVYCLLCLLVSFIIWEMDLLFQIVIERGHKMTSEIISSKICFRRRFTKSYDNLLDIFGCNIDLSRSRILGNHAR